MGLSGPIQSPFPRRFRARGVLSPLGSATVFREVRNEDELRQALTPLDTGTIAQLVANTGRRIVIAAPITLKSPIEIDESLPGTIIESHGKLPVFCGADGIDAFVVRAPFVTIRNLLISSPDVTGNASTLNYRNAITLKVGADNARIIDVDTFGCTSLVVGDAGCNDGMVRGCTVLVTSGDNGAAIEVDGTGWRVMGNILDGSGTGLAVEGLSNSGRCAIVGNDCNGDGIDTSVGTGLNTISGNTDAGTVTAHGTDDTLGGNT